MIGCRLSHYRILAKLGEGGMGEVYPADDTRLKRQVAIKILPQDFAADPGRIDRFEREAQTIAALNHRNIVTVYSVERSGETHFMTMEYVEGRTLAGVPSNRDIWTIDVNGAIRSRSPVTMPTTGTPCGLPTGPGCISSATDPGA